MKAEKRPGKPVKESKPAEPITEELKQQTLKGERRPAETELRRQTLRWLSKLEKEIKTVKSTDRLPKQQYKSLVTNMRAYVKDARHFMKKGDWVRAFEAVIYAWGIFETCQRVGIIKQR